ncbi:MAG: SdpI family protein [Lachnospiraceae bacterium]|nr:SdpI family protein [Lachnospiraceae bacterium]
MKKKDLVLTLVSSAAVLLPMPVGAILWSRLPDQIPTTFDLNGQIKNYSEKGFVVFAIPLFILVAHLLSSLRVSAKKAEKAEVAASLFQWICPAVSLLVYVDVYGRALGFPIDSSLLMQLSMGLLFAAVGLAMPHCSRETRIGYKLPWTLRSEENWEATHRRAGKLWIICAILICVNAFVMRGDKNGTAIFTILLIAAVILPVLYSMNYARRHRG